MLLNSGFGDVRLCAQNGSLRERSERGSAAWGQDGFPVLGVLRGGAGQGPCCLSPCCLSPCSPPCSSLPLLSDQLGYFACGLSGVENVPCCVMNLKTPVSWPLCAKPARDLEITLFSESCYPRSIHSMLWTWLFKQSLVL